MPLYAFKGVGRDGRAVSGVRDADSPKAVRLLLRKDGVVVTDVTVSKGKRGAQGKGLGKEVSLGEILTRVKAGEVAAFTRQLATLLKAGIPLAEGLTDLVNQFDNVKFKSALGEVRTNVNEGSSLADALAKHPKIFDDLYVSMVRAGEAAGNLDEVLERLSDFMEASLQLKAKVQGAMIYPVIMVVVGGGIMAVLMIAVVPRITELFTAQGVALPANTRLLIWMADAAKNFWWMWIMLIVGGFWGFKAWSRSLKGRSDWHTLVLKMPFVGPLVRQVAVARFARTAGTMLRAGVPMLRTLDIGKDVLGNVVLVAAIEQAKGAVTEGESLANTLKKSGHFPATVTRMIAVGERSGALEEMLLRIADAYERDVNRKLDRMTAMLEPIMLVVMGGAVAYVVFSVLLPMLEMQKLTRF